MNKEYVCPVCGKINSHSGECTACGVTLEEVNPFFDAKYTVTSSVAQKIVGNKKAIEKALEE